MNPVPLIPDTAPFTTEQRAWLNGFFAGVFSRGPAPAATGTALAAARPLAPLSILFGSQTGTAEGLAKKAAKEAGRRGFAATVLDMAQTDAARLASEKNLLVIVSTYGDGEPPDTAKALHAALAQAGTAGLPDLRFSVCALGDTNYAQFCQCGKDFDARLEKLGARRVLDRVDCNLEYEEAFARWLDRALGALAPETVAPVSVAAAAIAPPALEAAEPDRGSGYSRKNPFPALLLCSRNLNGDGSGKQVHHVEFSLADSGLVYAAGDALGVMPQNCPEAVSQVLAALGCDGEEAVPAAGHTSTSLRRALTELCDLGRPGPDLLAHFTGTASGEGATPTFHHVIDLLLAQPEIRLSPVDFVRALRKLQPRLYSISSSPAAHPGQVHLTVGAVRYEQDGRARKGVCSTFLADRAAPGQARVGVFVHTNPAFRPPSDGAAPMIMVGPGTGIAPFRAFLHERRAAGAKGRNWLFFGDQRAATDFLYRDELAQLRSDGTLTRLDTAFSRDQAEKIYVQHRMLEHATELYAWLEAGAHFYVCGDASRMAKDVDAALHQVVERAGGKTPADAAAYVQVLKSSRRYARDVY
jgi:sulfite reductase (NADPH) flavoprotein alpha-component